MRPHISGRALCCLLLLVLLPLAAPKAKSQSLNPQYFPESGHTLAEPFLSYWQATPDALRILGYPISEPFIEASFTEPGAVFPSTVFRAGDPRRTPGLDASVQAAGQALPDGCWDDAGHDRRMSPHSGLVRATARDTRPQLGQPDRPHYHQSACTIQTLLRAVWWPADLWPAAF